jgi:sodium pump decarboxylase gamma subunit
METLAAGTVQLLDLRHNPYRRVSNHRYEKRMILEGIKLSIIGILVVFIFLCLLVVVMHASAMLLRRYTEREALELTVYKRRSSANALLKDHRLLAVISAAVSAHRKRKGSIT